MTPWRLVGDVSGAVIPLSLALGIPDRRIFVSLAEWCLTKTITDKLGARADC